MVKPVISDGVISGVNWMRLNEQESERASALASVVLPTPRHILDEHMAFAQQRREHQFNHVVLAHDGAGYVLLEG